jgi:hypothetical protein
VSKHDPYYHNKHTARLYAEQDMELSSEERDNRLSKARKALQSARDANEKSSVAHYEAYLTRLYSLLKGGQG